MRHCYFVVGFLTLLGLVGGVALGDDKGDKKERKKLDPEAMFKKMDANNDGKVSKEEFSKYFETMRAKFGKGKVDGDTAKMFTEKLFEKLDANNDGVLTLEEFKKFREAFGQFGKKKKNAD